MFKEDNEGLYLPPGIEELESLYAPMKNLSRPLPSAKHYSDHSSTADGTMPIPHPLCNWNQIEALKKINRGHNRGKTNMPRKYSTNFVMKMLAAFKMLLAI